MPGGRWVAGLSPGSRGWVLPLTVPPLSAGRCLFTAPAVMPCPAGWQAFLSLREEQAVPIPHHSRSHRGSCGDGTEVASAPLTLLHCPHAAPPTLPEGLPAMPAGVPMFPVPPPGPGEPAPGFAEPSGPDLAARYPGPGLPPSAPSLQESTHLLRTQDPGGSARCRRGAELNGPPVPGAGPGRSLQ